MFAPAVTPPDQERERAQITAEAAKVYEEAKAGVDAQISRMERAGAWADREMDRITQQALADLRGGADPTAVETRMQRELAGVIDRATDPTFEPPAPATSVPTPKPEAPPPPAVVMPAASQPPTTIAPTPVVEPETPAVLPQSEVGTAIRWPLAIGAAAIVCAAGVWIVRRRRLRSRRGFSSRTEPTI